MPCHSLCQQDHVRLCQRVQAIEHRRLRLLDGALAGKAPRDDGLHDREEVLGAVMQLARQQRLPRLGMLALGDVARDLRCADDPALGIRIGDTVSEMSIRPPSLRCRTVS